MATLIKRQPAILIWKLGRWIPPDIIEECDNLAHAYRDSRAEEDLLALWRVAEPWVRKFAEDAWYRAAWRIGTVVEPDDLVSLGKDIFLERLLRRWDPFKASFLVYTLISCRIEFVKHNWKLMRRKPRFADPKELDRVEEPSVLEVAEWQAGIQVAIASVAKKDPKKAESMRWSLEHLSVPLRELARIHAPQHGFSRGTLHIKRRRTVNYLKMRLGIA